MSSQTDSFSFLLDPLEPNPNDWINLLQKSGSVTFSQDLSYGLSLPDLDFSQPSFFDNLSQTDSFHIGIGMESQHCFWCLEIKNSFEEKIENEQIICSTCSRSYCKKCFQNQTAFGLDLWFKASQEIANSNQWSCPICSGNILIQILKDDNKDDEEDNDNKQKNHKDQFLKISDENQPNPNNSNNQRHERNVDKDNNSEDDEQYSHENGVLVQLFPKYVLERLPIFRRDLLFYDKPSQNWELIPKINYQNQFIKFRLKEENVLKPNSHSNSKSTRKNAKNREIKIKKSNKFHSDSNSNPDSENEQLSETKNESNSENENENENENESEILKIKEHNKNLKLDNLINFKNRIDIETQKNNERILKSKIGVLNTNLLKFLPKKNNIKNSLKTTSSELFDHDGFHLFVNRESVILRRTSKTRRIIQELFGKRITERNQLKKKLKKIIKIPIAK